VSTDTTVPGQKNEKILQVVADAGDLFRDFIERLTDLNFELDVPADEIWDLLEEIFPEDDVHRPLVYGAWKALFPAAAMKSGEGMIRVIGKLLLEAPKLTDGKGRAVRHQSPAMECIIITKSGQQLGGALSTTSEDGRFTPIVRMGVTNERRLPNGTTQPVLVETLLEVNDIESVSVIRAIEAQASRIITG
jgi:hypothetical protein